MPLSADAVKRERQLANLKPGAHVTHGAHHEAEIQASAMTYLAELVGEFPGASERVLRLQARRLAKLDRLATFLTGRGEIRNRRTGDVFAASTLEERITAAYLAEHARLEQLQRERGSANPIGALESVADELAALDAGEDNDGGEQ